MNLAFLLFLFLIFFSIFIIAFLKLPLLFANLAECIPGLLFKEKTSSPESSDKEINFDFL